MLAVLISLALLSGPGPDAPADAPAVDFGPLCPDPPPAIDMGGLYPEPPVVPVDFSGLCPPTPKATKAAAFPARKFKPPVVPDAVLGRLNAARARAGSPPFRRDPRLDAAAQRHADDLEAGRVAIHGDFPGRVWAVGFPHISLGDPAIPFGNVGEFVGMGQSDVYDLDFLVTEPGRNTHGGDFREPKFDSIGIGKTRHHTVFDYGAIASAGAAPVAPTVYRLADAGGTTWTHADPAYLQRYVAARNATLAAATPGFVMVPGRIPVTFPTRLFRVRGRASAACVGGFCPR